MSRRMLFLVAFILGELSMLPELLSWKNHPVVEAIPIPAGVFNQLTYRKYVMKSVPHLNGGKRNLTVILTDEDHVRSLFHTVTGEYAPGLEGFYKFFSYIMNGCPTWAFSPTAHHL